MKDTEKIEKLAELKWPKISAAAWIRTEGKCAYCGADMLANATAYFTGFTEHILPTWKYRNRYADPFNATLACKHCNEAKGKWDPNGEGEQRIVTDAHRAITQTQHDRLIERVKEHIKEYKDASEKNFQTVKGIIRP
jgi:5-methylcytosine-specific restriction endonuclease McrA